MSAGGGVVRRSYPVSEVAAAMCGDNVKDPERWVMRRIYAGVFTGYKVGRKWRMWEEDVEAAYATLRNTPQPEPETSVLQLTAAAQRRRAS